VIKTDADYIWLLDVDGVINASRAGWSSKPLSGNAYFNGFSYRMHWAPQLISRMRVLLQQPSVAIVWATTWCGDTDQLEKLFKLPALPSAAPTRMEGSDKYKAALEVVDSGKKLIWTDDEFVPEFGPWYDELTKYNSSLLIKPRASRGLRPTDLDLIDQFVLGS
jgi:hypothetical protein